MIRQSCVPRYALPAHGYLLGGAVLMASTNRAIDRLDEQKRHELDNLVASWQVERMPLSAAEIEVLALYLLGEIDADERRRRLDALLR
jgi:anti-sigma-K factor RskA